MRLSQGSADAFAAAYAAFTKEFFKPMLANIGGTLGDMKCRLCGNPAKEVTEDEWIDYKHRWPSLRVPDKNGKCPNDTCVGRHLHCVAKGCEAAFVPACVMVLKSDAEQLAEAVREWDAGGSDGS